MPALNYSGSKDSTTEIISLHPEKQSEQSVLRPLSGELSVDEKLKLSNANFKQTIYDFFKDKNIKPLSQLTATPAFPTPHVLAQFAFKTYTDYKKRETDAQYEERLALPNGWKLLTTASNTSKVNGYFGAAYWNPQNQQVVIAHRGTDPTNVGALWTDYKGVMRNQYVQQMESASTFADKVVEVLQEVNQEKRPIFQVFFTGHSLGGWLAQVTTFTMKYLQIEGNTFVKSDTVPQSYHPHTVVFDSPGCKDMLSQMTDKFDVRLEGRSIDIDHLDITSYLSAPNRINTCNAHLGTVYRIFTNLSDMWWWEKNTALYNLATHSMQKIVEAFDPKTGQVGKDEQGKLKVQVVIDWPVSSGLRGGEEYKSFFKGAKHLNDYHQEVKDVTFQIEGYHPIRYQTKTYDEQVSRLSVFCQQERQFLESYRWLRQLPEFFNPKELFCVMEDKEVQKQAEEILRSFEIENDKIHAKNGSSLQAFIPYVKRLLQLFPQVKKSTADALSSNQVRNRVYQVETRRYIERIDRSPLYFKAEDLGLTDFVESLQKQVLQLQVVGGDEWTGIIKVYQVLQKTGRLSAGQYTVLKLKRLLSVNQLMDFSTVMLSIGKPHLLLMACDTNQLLNAEAQHTIGTIFSTIKLKTNIKIILSIRSESTTLHSLQQIGKEIFGTAFVERDEQLTWSDLTTSSQEKLLQKSVTFQDAKISLNDLISAESPIVNSLPFGVLLEEKELKIADPVPISSGYNEGYYIGRTFNHRITIKEDIFCDKYVRDSHVYVARSEQEFKKLCQLYPETNVHWLEKDESGDFVWQQSQGNLETLREYIDTKIVHTYTADDLEELLEQAQHKSVMLISDTAGMGKSTVLTHLSKQIKQNFPAKWVVRVDLNAHTDALKTLEDEQIDKEKVIEFISEKVLRHKPGLEMELFKQCCEQKQKVRVVIMLDGFDEISPFYKDTVIDLLQALRQTAVENLWVTTRPHLRNELEDKLQQLSYTLEPFSEENQIEFLTKFWSLKDWVTNMDNNGKEEHIKKLEIYAKELIKELVHSISDKEREFAGIPLQCRMLAEAFEKELQIFCHSPESMPDLPSKLDLIALYRKFIESKYDIYQEEKFQVRKSNVIAQEQRERDLKIMREDHQLLALKVLFNEETVALFHNDRECLFSDKQLSRIGIVQVSHDGKPHFIHRTFAEYYVADCLVNRLTDGNNTSEEIQNFILKDIFLEREYRVIRVFIDGLISSYELSDEVLKQYGNWIRDLGKDCEMIVHQAAGEANANIIGFLLDSVQAADNRDTIRRLLLVQDKEKRTAWHVAALGVNIQVLQRLWVWAKKVLTPQELKDELLLATVEFENTDLFSDKRYIKDTVLQKAAQQGKTEIFMKLWDCTKEELTTDEFKNEVLLAKDESKQTIWHIAATNGNVHIVEKMWEWAKEKLTTEEFNNKLLLAKDDMEQTVFHIAGQGGKTKLLQKIWEWSTEKLSAEEINILLLDKDEKEETAFHVAARFGKTEVLQKLWEWGNEKQSPEELKSNFLLNKNFREQTAFHVAANTGQTEVLQKLWEWGKEKLTPEELKDTFLLARAISQETVLHVAATGSNREVIQKIWAWAKGELTPEELKYNFLLAKSDDDLTAFHDAAVHDNTETLHELWECAKEKLTKEELKYKLLLAKDSHRRTAWHRAALEEHTEVLETLWEWAKEELTPDELNKNLLLGKDYKERTAWHLAVRQGYINLLLKLWNWAKEELTTEELHDRFLLATDDKEHTAWHEAIELGRTEILHGIWDCAKKELNPEKLYNELLLAKFDGKTTTAWHVAAMKGNEEILEKLWVLAKEIQTTEELNKNLLLARDQRERTALHVATLWSRMEVLGKLCEFADEETTMADVEKKLLLATDNYGVTAWQTAVISRDKYFLQLLWGWAKEKLTADELKHKLFLAKHAWGRTAWHDAAEVNNTELLDVLWEWGKDELTTEELRNNLLLAKDDQKKTAWHVAADQGNIESLKTIWEWAKPVLTAEELKNGLLLAKDDRQKSVFEVATEKGNTEVLEILHQWAAEELTPEELNNISCLSTQLGN